MATAFTAVQGDITRQRVDAIVNAANEALQHGAGVAGAIARAGGPSVQEESDAWVAEHGPVAPGRAAVTGGGKMPVRWVIHVVGPRYREGRDNAGLLAGAVQAALDTAAELGARTVAIPAISTGIFGYPPDEAVEVIVGAARAWVANHPETLDEVRFVAFDEAMAARFVRTIG